MYVNAKMIAAESVPRMGEGRDSSMTYLIHCKNLCKCYNVSTPSKTIKKRTKKTNKHY
jgi:hypothetical protein